MKTYDEVYQKVCEMICDAKDLDESALSPDLSLNSLRLDSLDYVELTVLAKKEFGVTLQAEMFEKQPDMTLGELCQKLTELQQG